MGKCDEETPQSIAQGQTEPPLQRFGNDIGNPLGIVARMDVELLRFDQYLPVFLHHGSVLLPFRDRGLT